MDYKARGRKQCNFIYGLCLYYSEGADMCYVVQFNSTNCELLVITCLIVNMRGIYFNRNRRIVKEQVLDELVEKLM
jgi:hypothetical protein